MSARAYVYSMLVLKIFFFVLGVWRKRGYNLYHNITKLNILTKVWKLYLFMIHFQICREKYVS